MHHRLSHATRKVILVAVAALAILVAATVGVVTASTTGIIFACVNVSSGTIHIVTPLDASTSSSSSSASTATATTTTTGTAGSGTAGTATTTSTTGTISTGTGTTGTVSTGTSTSGTTTTGTSTSGTTTTGTSTSGTATTGTTTAGTSTSGTGAGSVMAQVAVSPKAGPNPCAQNEVLLSWNTDGGTGGPPGPEGPTGPTGPTGPQGPTGAAGTGLAYHTESRVPVSIPTSFTSILHLDVPEGSYVVAATVLANNLGFTRVPVLCAITSPSDSGVISGVQLEPEVPQTEGRASGATLPVGLATTLPSGGRIDLQCQSNTGPAGATAQADQMQLTASTVTGIVRQ